MKALLLAAGTGSRLRPLTYSIPKCLVEIAGKPLLGHWLDLLVQGGVTKFLVNLHYLPEQVESYLASHPSAHLIKTTFEAQLLGTGGTLLHHQQFFENDTTLLVHADNASLFEFSSFVTAHDHRPPHCPITMMTFASDCPQSCGIVEVDKQGIVQKFFEKVRHPPGNLANGAVYMIEPEIFPLLKSFARPDIDFSCEVLPRLLGKIFTFFNDVYHRDIGTPESLHCARREFPPLLIKHYQRGHQEL